MRQTDALRAAVRDVSDFPKAGILFKDITPILGNGILLRFAVDCLVADCAGQEIQKIVGIDARGFLFGATVADRLGIGFVPIRKRGKLPWKTESVAYKLEYADAAAPEDHHFQSNGITVIVDPKSLPYIDGTELDFAREGLNEGFKFNNPNVKDECGCGESFNI